MVEALGEQEGYQRVQGAQESDGGVRGQRGVQGWIDAHALQACQEELQACRWAKAVHGGGRVSSSLPLAPTPDFLGGAAPER